MLTKEDLLFETQFKVRAFDTSLDQNISELGLVQMMHEASLEQTIKHKISALELGSKNMGWVMLNHDIEFYATAQMGQKLKVITYPSGIEKIFTYRDYLILDEQDQVLAKSCSRFIMMDLVARKMIKVPDYILEMMVNAESFYDIPRAQAVKIRQENLFFEDDYKVRFNDLDFNFHLNTQFYFRWVLNTLPFEFLKSNRLNFIQMGIKEECGMDDLIHVSTYDYGDKNFGHVLKKGNSVSANVTSTWKQR